MKKIFTLIIAFTVSIVAVEFAQAQVNNNHLVRDRKTSKEHNEILEQQQEISKNKTEEFYENMLNAIALSSLMNTTMSEIHSDGTFIVISGTKMLKYDRDMKLLKEVEIEIDVKRLKDIIKSVLKD